MSQIVQPQSIVQMDDLVDEVCWRLASTASVARVGFVIDGAMQILPVNFALLGHTIVFRTAQGSALDSIAEKAPVVVEMDHVDVRSQTGWSVVVRGVVEKLNRDLLPLVGNSVHPWADGEKDVWMSVRPEEVTGRAISRRVDEAGFRLPYMALD